MRKALAHPLYILYNSFQDRGGSKMKERWSPLFSMKVKIFNTFWHASRDAFFLFDSSIRILDLNAAALKMWKKNRGEVIGRKLVELSPPTKPSGRFRRYQEVIRTGKPCFLKDITHPSWGGRQIDIFAFKVLDGMGMIVSDITRRHAIETNLQNSNQLLQNLSFHNQLLREEETKALAREIHDEMAPTLTAFKMDLHWVLSCLRAAAASVTSTAASSPPVSPVLDPAVEAKINAMSDLVDQTIGSMRRICSELRPALLDDLGLIDALEWQVQEYRKRSNLDCRLKIDCDGLSFGPDLSLCVFRIFQEAFTNVVRHAQSSKIRISLVHAPARRELRLRVRDNGRGILPAEASDPKSFGLIGMRERLGPYGGRFKITGVPGKGTTVSVTIPLAKTAPAPAPKTTPTRTRIPAPNSRASRK